jgi:hypothetical protein
LCSSLRLKPSSLGPPQQALAGALQEGRADLLFTTSVENRESPLSLYIGHYPGTRTGAPIREARGCPLRAWAREGRVHPPPSPAPHEPSSCLCRATGGYVGDLQVQDTAVSLDSVLTVNTPLRPSQRPLRASLTSSVSTLMFGVLVKPYRRSSWLFFSFSCSQGQYLVSPPADHHWVR